jgi:hypothetical protein
VTEKARKSKTIWALGPFAWGLGTSAALSVCFLLCRFAFLEWHGMKQWPLVLFIFGLAVVLIAALTRSGKVMVGTVVGYMAGFILAMLFSTDGVDPGGGSTNNGWIIWAAAYLAILAASVAWQVIGNHLTKASPHFP